MTTTMPDLDDPAFLVGDRAEAYRALRDEAPVLRIGASEDEVWLVSRHEDVQAVVRTTSARVQPPGQDAPGWMPEGPARRRLRANLVQTDRPIHTRLRGVVGALFTARQSDLLRAAAAAEVAAELDALSAGGVVDAVELAARVPRGVLRLLIGMPDEDWAPLLATQLEFLAIFSHFPLAPEQQARLDEVTQSYFDYFDDLLGRLTEPPELVRRLLAAEEAGELSHDEVLSVMHTVLDAGFETTRTSITNVVELFATVPGLLGGVASDPTLVVGMVEETLRLRAPVQVVTRILTEDHAASDGTVLPAGARVLALVGAANLDERVFADPTAPDLRRENAARHLSFGGGLHHCLGAPLARVQLQETVAAVARRYERVELAGFPARHPSLIFPSLHTLPVRFVPVS
ncbi:cytochrome P450 [Actinomycetospora termitidis]|uniref:Cytochrome P450 n=1 Tax=Actinomycetospora termitidis TaxID=3053470 RepID=A0ABT7MGA2_9PSEU|nr:cytochrome P450 [Actinomycetospora sp. Odt1-22]MDL5159706.1 cytochrome P450 [Actinomycetospora sp. Odt1-22]